MTTLADRRQKTEEQMFGCERHKGTLRAFESSKYSSLVSILMNRPHYPQIRVTTASRNAMALVAVVRQALRKARADSTEIDQFTEEALTHQDPRARRQICLRWVQVG